MMHQVILTHSHCFQGAFPCCDDPVILGHEFSGIVSAVGPEVTHLKPGDHVAVDPNRSENNKSTELSIHIINNVGKCKGVTNHGFLPKFYINHLSMLVSLCVYLLFNS